MEVDPTIERDIEIARATAQRRVRQSLIAIAVLVGAVVVAAIAAGVWFAIKFNT